MIIPGVSGSMVLMLLGYYNPVLNARGRLENRRIQHGLCRHGRPRF